MSRTLDIVERQLGDRCCDRQSRSSIASRDAERIAEEMQLLGHPVRLQLLDVLARNEGRVCVCDLEAAVPVKQPTVSHHLRILREAGLIDAERVGQWMFYRVRRDALGALRDRIGAMLEAFV
ncbi:MAG: metalloregulator ArsR/SmtB family transcription factor [Gemmatimonadota bacterium]